jgi:hypothetical protein
MLLACGGDQKIVGRNLISPRCKDMQRPTAQERQFPLQIFRSSDDLVGRVWD